MNWYIGQRIVAIRDHSQGVFKRGDEFVVRGLKQSLCKCGFIAIDIGLHPFDNEMLCVDCNTILFVGDVWWFHEEMFSPLDEIEVAISELMEQTQVQRV